MELRHPYRLLSVLLGMAAVWIVMAFYFGHLGVAAPLAVLYGWLALSPATAVFVGANLAYDKVADRENR